MDATALAVTNRCLSSGVGCSVTSYSLCRYRSETLHDEAQFLKAVDVALVDDDLRNSPKKVTEALLDSPKMGLMRFVLCLLPALIFFCVDIELGVCHHMSRSESSGGS